MKDGDKVKVINPQSVYFGKIAKTEYVFDFGVYIFNGCCFSYDEVKKVNRFRKVSK